MTAQDVKLPDEISLCHQMIADLIANQQKSQLLIDKLQHQLEQMLRHRFGQRADRIDPDQLALFVAEQTTAPAQPEENGEDEKPDRARNKNRSKHGRRPLPKDLPRERIEHDVPPDQRGCPKCGRNCQCIGEETSEQLEYTPASLKVIEHARKKYACCNRNCEGAVITADKPWQPIEKGLAGPGLLAQVIVGKYCDHLPLYRQVEILARHGVDISRSTMCGWAMSCADLLQPLYKLQIELVLASKVIHTDDTTVPVLDRSKTKTRIGRIWGYVGDKFHPYVVYDYTPDRKRAGPEEFLGDFAGYIQADAYPGYDVIFKNAFVIEVGCWAHGRRYFIKAQVSDPARSLTAVAFIKQLYKVEREARDLDADARKVMRQEKSKPVLDKFEQWLREEQVKVLPKSPMGEAIFYVLGNWQALTRYLDDGDLDIDNNEVERVLRLVAIGRKNWMFVGNDRGGRAAAIFYSFIQTCKLHGIDPFEYLRDILTRLSSHPQTRLDELLPDNWLRLRQETQTDSPASLPESTPAVTK